MLFSSVTFLCYFLPCFLAGYFLVPKRWKNMVLLLGSLIFYGWGEPKYLLLLLGEALFSWCWGLLLEKKKSKLLLGIGVGALLGGLVFFKYADLLLSTFNNLVGADIPLLKIALPIGISFYTFQTLSYLVDVYRGEVQSQKDPIAYGAYVAAFPQLIAGPIVRYAEIAPALKDRRSTWEGCAEGVLRFAAGLGKKVLLADQLGELCNQCGASVGGRWLYAIAFALQIYFDFSGYSDMAIGLGRMLGFSFPENFDHPFISKSVTEFWRRWHMTLGRWFRDYVYIPLGGNRVPFYRQILNILLVWGLTGLWHGASWNFLLWGLYFAVFLVLEKWVLLKFLKKAPAFVGHLYLLLVTVFSFVVFNASTAGEAVSFMGDMLFLGGLPLLDSATGYYAVSYLGVLVLALLGATPLPRKLLGKLPPVLRPVLGLIVLALSLAFILNGSFHPFLYFRF